MKNSSARFLQIAAAIFTSFLVFFFVNLAWVGFIADSEIWSVTLAKNFRSEWLQPWVFTRVFFYAPLAIAVAPFETASSIFGAAKIAMIFNGFLILLFTYRLSSCLSKRDGVGVFTPWLSVIFLLSNTGFMNQGYRIRSDLVSCTLVLLALQITFRANGRHSLKKMLVWGMPFLATPKAAIHVFPALALFDRRKILLVFFLGFFLTILVYPSAISFFLNTYTDPEARMGFFSWQRFEYLVRVAAHNGIIVLAFGLRFLTLLIRLRLEAFDSDSQKSIHRGFGLFILWSLVVLILSPEKVPFFVASFLPVFSVFASLLLDDVLAVLQKNVPVQRLKFFSALLMPSLILSSAALTLRSGLNWNGFRENNASYIQLSLIKKIEEYLNRYPKATYYDVVGLVPQKASIRLFAGPNDPIGNQNSFLMLKSLYQPDLIFKVRKIHYFEPGISELLRAQYFPISTSAFGRWHRLEKPLPLPLKDPASLESIMNKMADWAGTSNFTEITVLVESKGQAAKPLQLQPSDLKKPNFFGPSAKLLAYSPFVKIDSAINMLPEIIRFDWDWTGSFEDLQEGNSRRGSPGN